MSRRFGFEGKMKNGRSLFRGRPLDSGVAGELKDAGRLGVLGVEFGDLNSFREADLAEEPDAVVVDVELVPGEAVTGADGVGVVVVVPAFAAGEESDPPVVAGIVLGLEAALAPEVGCRVDEPGGVKADGDAEEGSPEDHAEGTDDVVAGAGEGCLALASPPRLAGEGWATGVEPGLGGWA